MHNIVRFTDAERRFWKAWGDLLDIQRREIGLKPTERLMTAQREKAEAAKLAFPNVKLDRLGRPSIIS